MSSFFATEYTIHFDDTMAYGSHHFLTAFKFQCAAREAFLFGERIFDVPGVKEALDDIHLFTSDAYSRNLNPARLGDRIAILLTLEEWGRASARFCYRVINEQGQPICAGFQTLVSADAKTGHPVPLPTPLWKAMEQMREIEEPRSDESFRDRVLAGGSKLEALFAGVVPATAQAYLAKRYPSPGVVEAIAAPAAPVESHAPPVATPHANREAWVFSGQGALAPKLLTERIAAYAKLDPANSQQLQQCAAIAQEFLGGDAAAIVSGSSEACADAVKATPELSQVAIHLQNVLGALLRQAAGYRPEVLMGHSFGEIAALGVGGAFDLPTGVRIVCERARAIAHHAPAGGGLLAVGANRGTVAAEATLHGLEQVVVAGRNHEEQTIASGPRDQLNQLQSFFRSRDVAAVAVASPTSFHHPCLRAAAMAWLEHLRALPLASPAATVYSPIGRRFITPGDDIAITLASQFLRPFDLEGAVADVMESGVTRLVDCGSTGSLARILAKASGDLIEVVTAAQPSKGETQAIAPERPAHTSAAPPYPAPDIAGDRAVTGPSNGVPVNRAQVANPIEPTEDRTLPPIAITGQGCILPGGASSPQQLYAAIFEQRNGIVDQREYDQHWSEDFYSPELVPDRTTSPLTGRVNDEDIVTPEGIDPEVFRGFTRAQRLLAIALVPCLPSLQGAQRVMCLIGATADGFEDQDEVSSLRFAEIEPSDPQVDERMNTARSAFQEPHDAVREVFDRLLKPGLDVILIDAACASSLYTVALGMKALEANETDAVIAGGVFCPGPGNSCLFSQFHGTTSTGCRPFDAGADGVVFSEGSALVTLRRLSDAQQQNLPISAVLRGAGVSSDGRSSSANVPQTHGQILSLQRCYDEYRIDPASVHAIEAHGTSTPVGDSTELVTLQQFFGPHTTSPLPIHSLKGLLGHAGWAAGTASVIAVCEYLREGFFPEQGCHQESSPALLKASDTLGVLKQPRPLTSPDCRIAIDGFGFGGANAHVVIDRYRPGATVANEQPSPGLAAPKVEDELVFVACTEVTPTVTTPAGLQFDRQSVSLPEGHVLLPDLEEDMDISQTLAIRLVHEVATQIPAIKSDLRRETSLVLAQGGKTERGVEATMRVLADRFRRNLTGLESCLEKVQETCDRSKPSGPYTLQCMMPNVSSGRAALRFNLNGPNFVVDAGDQSLEAAMNSASLLLRGGEEGGTKIAIVAAINANPWRAPLAPAEAAVQEPHNEYAAAFAVMTRNYAQQLGLSILGTVEAWLRANDGERATAPIDQKVRALIENLSDTEQPAAASLEEPKIESKFPIHVPVWVEAPIADRIDEGFARRDRAVLAVTPSDPEQVANLMTTLPSYSRRHLVVVVGPGAHEVATEFGGSSLLPFDLSDEDAIAETLAQVEAFGPDSIVAVESIGSWNLTDSLSRVATDNSLCEGLFLLAQHFVAKLKEGALDLWGVFLDGWNGAVHPASGAVSGMLKAITREIPAARIGVVATRGLLLSDACEAIQIERCQRKREPEVVYDGATRLVRRLRQPLRDVTATAQVELNKDSVVLATGGARGVTAVMIDKLLRDYGCTVVVLGRSALEAGPADGESADAEGEFYTSYLHDHPQASAAEMKKQYGLAQARWEAHRTVQELSALGGSIEYFSGDVTDPDQVARVVHEVADKYGRIDLVVHGAGVQFSQRLEHRSLADFRKTYAVKVSGLRNVVEQCRAEFGKTVSAHVLTSAYSLFGNDGQHDYGAANETMDRLCGLTESAGDPKWSSIAWLAWDGVGMTRGSEYQALAKQRQLSGMTVESGQRLFDEVLSGRTHAAINVPMSDAEHVRYEVATLPPATAVSPSRVLEVNVELSKVEWLDHHKVRQTPTLPGAWILERMVNAALQLRSNVAGISSAIVEDTTFSRFVRHVSQQEPNLRVVAEEHGESISVWMVGDVLHPTGAVLSKDIVFAQATVRFESQKTDLQSSLQNVGASHDEECRFPLSDPYCDGRFGDVELSGPFDCVRDIAIGPVGRQARFVPNRVQNVAGVIPALLLDSAWRVGAMYAVPGKDELYVPVQIGRLVLPIGPHTAAASDWEIRATSPRLENGRVRWDRTEVFNEIGALQMLVEDAFATRLQ